MNTWIVCWPDQRTSFIRARDEAQLRALLSARAEPEQCRFKVYDGPLWIDVDLDALDEGAIPGVVAEEVAMLAVPAARRFDGRVVWGRA